MKHGLKVFIEHYKSKEHWYIKYITWGIIGIVCFAILVHIFKELGFLPAQKIFDFFDDWAMVLSAAVMLLLAGAAVWAIMDNRHGRRVDRKERLLNEIIEWSVDFKTCLYSTDVLGKEQKTLYAITHLRIVGVNAKRKKIETIAQKVFGDDLFKAVYEVESSVAQYLGVLEFIIGIDEKFISLDEEKKAEMRSKIEQARAKGREEIDTVLDRYVQSLVDSTTNLIEKCSALITQL